jgi:hypothetical protein
VTGAQEEKKACIIVLVELQYNIWKERKEKDYCTTGTVAYSSLLYYEFQHNYWRKPGNSGSGKFLEGSGKFLKGSGKE